MKEDVKIVLTDEAGDEIELYVLEETRISGKDYILAADTPDEDGECYILRDNSGSEEAEALYEIVEDENELDYLLGIFSELLEDVEIDPTYK